MPFNAEAKPLAFFSPSSSLFMVSVSQRCLHLIRVSMSITPVLKNTLKGPWNKDKDEGKRVRGRQREGDLKARRNIIRYYDLTFMCSPHVTVLCLFAPQRDMTATLELLKTQIFNDYGHGNED